MKKVLKIIMLLTVTITVVEPERSIVCLKDQPQMERQADGTYIRIQPIIKPELTTCRVHARRWQELWTDFPENGGHFIKRIEKEKNR